MVREDPIWISESDVVSMMTMGDAIRALEVGLQAEARNEAENMVKTHVTWGNGSTLHAIGAAFPKAGFVGTKTWAHTEGGATPLVILFDSANGALKAVVEAFAMGQLRTGAASGLATQRLAAKEADDFAIIGTGRQALPQTAAILAVRPIKRVRVFGPNSERRARLAAQVQETFGVEVVACPNVASAVSGAPIITLVTRAKEPFLDASMVARGAHINAIGAIVPSRAEFCEDIFPRCSQIIVDSVPQSRKLSREFIDYFGSGKANWEQVRSLADLVAFPAAPGETRDLTLFKSLGMGISDLALCIELYKRARERGVGRGFAHPQPAAPKLDRTTSHKEHQA